MLYIHQGVEGTVIVAVETSKKAQIILQRHWLKFGTLKRTLLTRTGSSTDTITGPQGMLGIDAKTTPAAAIATLAKTVRIPLNFESDIASILH